MLLTLAALVGWQTNKVSLILAESIHIDNTGDRIEFISGKFIGTPYMAHTMKGSPDDQEELVINLDGMDCFTFLDYVEALRLSANVDDFINKLKKSQVFRRGGGLLCEKEALLHRLGFGREQLSERHHPPELPGATTVEKIINRKSGKTNWLKNVPQTMRMTNYVPPATL